MANFSHLDGAHATAFTGITTRPTKAEMIERGAAYVERANDNAGTYILDASGREIGYVPNSHSEGGIWLYYSSDVRDWLGLSAAAEA